MIITKLSDTDLLILMYCHLVINFHFLFFWLEIHPLILMKVKVIDLSLSTPEVQGIILSDLIQSKCSELWLKLCQLQRDKQVCQDKLHADEVK